MPLQMTDEQGLAARTYFTELGFRLQTNMMMIRLSPITPPYVRMEDMSSPSSVYVVLDGPDVLEVLLVEEVSVFSTGSGGGPVI